MNEPKSNPQPVPGRQRPQSRLLPEGHRWLSSPIPDDVHAHVHHQARLSNMNLKDYLAWFLRSAKPYVPETNAGQE
ncbi:MAG TPA: hypothetical protein VNQ76_17525 [Planctomicrobium sp.]|nr:hypothetical protein [Planctomicrobium sp.]